MAHYTITQKHDGDGSKRFPVEDHPSGKARTHAMAAREARPIARALGWTWYTVEREELTKGTP